MSLVVFTGFAGLVLAPGQLDPLLSLIAVLCIAIAAGGAGAINMWYDRDIDALMARTRNRPIPAGRLAPQKALAFGFFISLIAVILIFITIATGGFMAGTNSGQSFNTFPLMNGKIIPFLPNIIRQNKSYLDHNKVVILFCHVHLDT